MKKYTADWILSPSGKLEREMVLTCEDNGRIVSLKKISTEDSSITKFNGILCPGFINAHCHLELSFMKGKIAERTGLIDFVKQVVAIRDEFSEEEQQKAIQDAYNEMYHNGIVAVGDISNDTRSFKIKGQGKMRFHTFVEVFDLDPAMTAQAIENGKETLKNALKIKNSTGSITPHAPYSCTPELQGKVSELTQTSQYPLLSIHMQEHPEENSLFESYSGEWVNLFKDWGLDHSWFKKSGKKSLATTLPFIGKNKVLFVHNTFTTQDDISEVQEKNIQAYWCFCPNANMYIQNTLPDYNAFKQVSDKCVLGTDSLASNWSLSILDEMKMIQSHDKTVPLDQMLVWATKNGAELLNFEELGTFSEGKTPGVLNITELGKEFDLTRANVTRLL